MLELKRNIHRILSDENLTEDNPEREYLEQVILPLVNEYLSASKIRRVSGVATEPIPYATFNQNESALLLGISIRSLKYWRDEGSIPQPHHAEGNEKNLYYSFNDIQEIASKKKRLIPEEAVSIVLQARRRPVR